MKILQRHVRGRLSYRPGYEGNCRSSDRQSPGTKRLSVYSDQRARVDGHDFIPQVFEKGALVVLSDHALPEETGPIFW